MTAYQAGIAKFEDAGAQVFGISTDNLPTLRHWTEEHLKTGFPLLSDFNKTVTSAYGVLRGMHYQDMTAPMGKLLRCTVGRIFDVAVDLRVSSPTLGKWFSVELSADNMRQIYVPPGFAHGFATLSDSAEVQYKQTGFYTPPSEGTLVWNDPDVGIQWPITNPTLSKRDQNGMSLKEYLKKPAFS